MKLKVKNLILNIVIIIFLSTSVKAENKSIIKNINNKAKIYTNVVFSWVSNEWLDTIQYQKTQWNIGKEQTKRNKEQILKIASEGLKFERSVNSLDAVTFSYLWLKSRNQIKIIGDFYHHHRKRSDSVSFTEKNNTSIAINYFIQNTIKLINQNEK